MEYVGLWVRAGITLLLFGLAAWWLLEVANVLDVAPTTDAKGNVVDRFERAKDVLLVVLPLLTSALGYWFGAAGKTNSDKEARQARDKLETALDKAQPGLLGR